MRAKERDKIMYDTLKYYALKSKNDATVTILSTYNYNRITISRLDDKHYVYLADSDGCLMLFDSYALADNAVHDLKTNWL